MVVSVYFLPHQSQVQGNKNGGGGRFCKPVLYDHGVEDHGKGYHVETKMKRGERESAKARLRKLGIEYQRDGHTLENTPQL